MQGKIKWLFVLFLTVQINAQSERVSEFYEYYQKLQRGDTLTFSVPQLRKIYPLLMSLLLTLPINGQVIMMGDKGYTPALDIIPPSIPKGLNGVAVSDDSLLFYWTNPPEGDFVKNYVWFYGALKDSTVNDSIYIGGLLPNKTYGLRVKSRDDKYNYSVYSDSVQVTTLDTVTMPEVPAKPTNLVVTDSLDALTLQFTANGINTSYFDIQRDDLDYDTIDFSTKSVLVTWSEADTTDGVYHEYKVKARNATGSSAYCDSVIAERYTSNTYYVSSGGSNSNSGTNPNLAWQTLSKVNSEWLEGLRVYIKRGDSLNGNLIIQNDNVVLASYGTGTKPKITNVYDLPGWTVAGNWTQLGNIWEITMTGERIYRLWINGTEVYQASWDNNLGEYFGNGSHLFLHSIDENKFWVYSTSNPSSAFSSMKIAGYKVSGVDKYHTVELNGDYITVKGLDIQNGLYSSLTGNRHYATIEDCNIGYNTNKHGICLQRSTLTQGDGWILKRDSIVSNWVYDYEMYDVSTPYGIYTKGDNWTIDSCYIKNWWFGIYSAGNSNTISNNEITSTDWNFTKGIQIYPRSTAYWWQRNVVYNNFIHNVKAVGMSINSSGNKVYFNIIDSVLCSTLEEKDAASPGCTNTGNAFEFTNDGDLGASQIDSNYIFNNTIYYTDRTAYFSTSSPRYTKFYNNLMVNTRRHFNTPNLQAMEVNGNAEVTTSLLKNNIHYNTGSLSSIYFISGTSSPYTVAGLNSAYPSNAIDNFYSSESSVADLITVNTWVLPTGSDALNAGINIESLVGSGFKDRLGNTVDRATPNIGAIDN